MPQLLRTLVLGAVLAVVASGCVVVPGPGYAVAPPAFVVPAPVVVAPAPVIVGPRYGYYRFGRAYWWRH
jgi:hypothetical protein